MASINNQKYANSYCQIVIFPWGKKNVSDSDALDSILGTSILDVSNYITHCSFEKSLTSPSGTFSFTLQNSQDWKSVIKPGTWCLIYMSNDRPLAIPSHGNSPSLDQLRAQSDKIRGICYIERVAVEFEPDEKGTKDFVYQVSGRDFGIVYDETRIWHNFMQFESTFLDTLNTQVAVGQSNATIDNLLKNIHRLFYSPQDLVALANKARINTKQFSVLQVGSQWVMPPNLTKAANIEMTAGREPFYGYIKGLLDNFSPVKATYPIDNVMAILEGNAWDKLKTYSIEPFHELFPETDDFGYPRLTFRPIPWKTNDKGYPTLSSQVQSLLDLPSIEVDTTDVFSFDIGEDDHGRYNHFYMYIESTAYNAQNNISTLKQVTSNAGRQFPYAKPNSIARHGFRPMHVGVNTIMLFGKDGVANPNLLIEYNEILMDYWDKAAFYESGMLTQSGRNDVKIGKTLTFDSDMPYLSNRIFYIEGYHDQFNSDGNGTGDWTQTLSLTRGTNVGTLISLVGGSTGDNLVLTDADKSTEGVFVGKKR